MRHNPDTMWHLPDTMWYHPDIIGPFPGTMWHHPGTMWHLPGTMWHLPGTMAQTLHRRPTKTVFWTVPSKDRDWGPVELRGGDEELHWPLISVSLICEGQSKGRGWQYHLKYIKQNWYSYLLRMHWTNRCQVAVIASWHAYKATTVRWHQWRKCQKISCPLYLLWHFQHPP